MFCLDYSAFVYYSLLSREKNTICAPTVIYSIEDSTLMMKLSGACVMHIDTFRLAVSPRPYLSPLTCRGHDFIL